MKQLMLFKPVAPYTRSLYVMLCMDPERLQEVVLEIPGVGIKTAKSVKDYFSNKENIRILTKLLQAGFGSYWEDWIEDSIP